jgi:1-acyl-sn-glycerol-3-phosphate acyltransferase
MIVTQNKNSMTEAFKNIFARVWALWGLITFIITFCIFFLPSMASHLFKNYKKGQDFFMLVSKIWISIWITLIGCSLKVFGKENFAPNQHYIVLYNHNAFLDVPISATFIPGGNKTIGKDSFAKVPIFSWFYKRGAILVNRKSDKSRIKSYELMKQALASGVHMCIYPEGTRNRTAEPLKPFYDGAFKLAIDTKTAIIPALILHTKKAMPINKTFYLLPTALQIHFLPPVTYEATNAKILNENVFGIMKNFYVENGGT